MAEKIYLITQDDYKNGYIDIDGVRNWICPPLDAETEYMLAERFLGKPVYIKCLSCGTLPSNDVSYVAHGIADAKEIVDFGGTSCQEGNAKPLSLPFYNNSTYFCNLGVTHENIVIAAGSGMTDAELYTDTKVWVKYTKTTD